MSRPDFHHVFDASPNAYMLLDRDLRYVAANPAYQRATARSLGELIGRGLFEVFPHDPHDPTNESARLLRDSLERVLRSGQIDVLAFIPYRIERTVDGVPTVEDRFWSATHTPLLDERGRVELILQHTVDVTELHRLRMMASGDERAVARRQMEAGVLDRAERVQRANVTLGDELRNLRRVFEQAPGFAAFVSGPEHVFELANRAYLDLIGGRPILGRRVQDAIPEVASQGYIDALTRVYKSGEPFVGHAQHVLLHREPGAAAEELVLDFVFQPITDGGGRVFGIFILGYDITELKRSQERLRERAEFEQQLVGIVSHDLRNPINAIGIATSLLLQRGRLDDQQARLVSRIMSASDRARRLIRDFLDFTQARASGRLPVTVGPANIRQLARQVFDETHLAHIERDAVIVHEGEETGEWDADRLGQVIANLLGNAFQHGSAGTPVRLTTRGTADALIIDVRNGGAPIPGPALARLFEPFHRGDAARTTAERSVGLGLYIAKQIVEAHGGTIDVRSTVDEGTVFSVRLPRFVRPDDDRH